LSTLGIVDAAQTITAVALSRSTNGGATFDPPVEVVRSPDNTVLLDKDWLAVNTFSNTPTAGRLLITYTRIDSNGYSQARVYSDDGGKTWSPWAYFVPTPSDGQGAQPVFLPDGRLAIVYMDLAFDEPDYAYIRAVISNDGGANFGAPNLVTRVLPFASDTI